MGKDKTGKAKKQTRKLRDLPAKAKRAAAVKAGKAGGGKIHFSELTIKKVTDVSNPG